MVILCIRKPVFTLIPLRHAYHTMVTVFKAKHRPHVDHSTYSEYMYLNSRTSVIDDGPCIGELIGP